MATGQTQATSILNQVTSNAQALLGLYYSIKAMDQAWTDNGVAVTSNNMVTAALNLDGSLGIADGAPNVAHPIDTRVIIQLNRTLSANQYASMETILKTIITLVEGGAVSAQASARAILNQAAGG